MTYLRNITMVATMTLPVAAGCSTTQSAHANSTNSANSAHADSANADSTSKNETRSPYALPDLNHGLIQSPVNILSNQTVVGHHDLKLTGDSGCDEVVNTGHTIELDFPQGTTFGFDGKDYELLQLHFHTPSEHQVDGVTYPMEMHVVHTRENEDGATEYLVIGLLFRMGDPSSFIASFLDAVPSHSGEHAALKGPPVHISSLLQDDLEYYHYNGSLTTPPYTESVTWLVAKQPLSAAPEQIQKINRIEGDNARHVQATYGRVIDN